MHNALAQIKTLFNDQFKKAYGIQRVEVGTLAEAYSGLAIYNDLPFVLIAPDGESTVPSFWGNSITKRYNIKLYVALAHIRPNDSRIKTDSPNQGKTVSEITDEMQRILGTDKELGGGVTRWPAEWQIREFNDDEGRAIREIKTHWLNELIPWTGPVNNQTDLIST